jgi:hypothetical protein
MFVAVQKIFVLPSSKHDTNYKETFQISITKSDPFLIKKYVYVDISIDLTLLAVTLRYRSQKIDPSMVQCIDLGIILFSTHSSSRNAQRNLVFNVKKKKAIQWSHTIITFFLIFRLKCKNKCYFNTNLPLFSLNWIRFHTQINFFNFTLSICLENILMFHYFSYTIHLVPPLLSSPPSMWYPFPHTSQQIRKFNRVSMDFQVGKLLVGQHLVIVKF